VTLRLRSSRIVTPAGTVAGEVVVEDGRISSVSPGPAAGEASDWLVPGYIDTHVHGGGDAQFNTSDPDEVLKAARFHARHGTTGLLATTVAAPVSSLEACLGAIASCVGRSGVLGAHLEGPFLSAEQPGAMDPSAFVSPDPAVLSRLLSAGRGTVRVMTLAPELPGAIDLILGLVDSGVVPSIGHTDADYSEASAAVRAGARAATHVFNAMRPLHHREPGVVGAVLDLPEVSCELICDGVHVDPTALRLAWRAKGGGGIRLVTDAIEAAGMPDGAYRLGRSEVVVSAGRATVLGGDSIAGSTLTMDVAVHNAVRFLRITVEEAIVMASGNPARLLGIADRKGAIRAGMDADLVVLDEELRVRRTMIAGEWVYSA
jgi:N-acetylglucosamine-6-phosphate deacetylase